MLTIIGCTVIVIAAVLFGCLYLASNNSIALMELRAQMERQNELLQTIADYSHDTFTVLDMRE